MATRTPTVSGLALAPNAAAAGNNPAASNQEFRVHRFWGRWTLATQLPNASGNAASGAAWAALRPGDVAFAQTPQRLYVLRDRGTSGGANALWLQIGIGVSGRRFEFGGKTSTAGHYFRVSGDPTGGAQVALDQNVEAVVGVASTLTTMTWNTVGGGATTVFKIWKNGGVVVTKTLGTAAGFDASFSVAFAAGDKLAVNFDSGAGPSETGIGLVVE